MSLPERCNAVHGRLSDALLAREPAATSDLEHAGRCDACGPHQRGLDALSAELSADVAGEASDALVDWTLARARRELAQRDAAHAAPLQGFPREVARLLGLALLPLPLVLAWNAAVLAIGGEILTPVLPASLLRALGAGYVVAGTTWLAFLYGSLPLLAHRQLARRLTAPMVPAP